ncbi:hypothetical protein JX265_004281 [Neoarthrinium moseri]|uniref:Ubiquitin-like domain-containing protein n=1 Tax=Neoarthrinium moseri TaxID=1658444 RepID=A0A9P9WQK9_9PEZI|nr:hypothetical protein JX266_003853 [Neoarthrinium moseri]KAI1875223.1 hypothetical protein JX265_004281 [Neoarthrinium moseri]
MADPTDARSAPPGGSTSSTDLHASEAIFSLPPGATNGSAADSGQLPQTSSAAAPVAELDNHHGVFATQHPELTPGNLVEGIESFQLASDISATIAESSDLGPVGDEDSDHASRTTGLAPASGNSEEVLFDGSRDTEPGPGDPEPLLTAGGSGSSSSRSKGKETQKQKAVHFERDEAAGHTIPGDNNMDTHLPDYKPLKPGEPGWNRSPERPPVKLPIRFQDAVGRHYVFPWERVRTWEGMERLIKAAFLHVNILGPHVQAGHYDLTAETGVTFEDPYATSAEPSATTSGPCFGNKGQPVTIVPASALAPGSSASGASSSTAPPPVPSPPAAGSPSPSAAQGGPNGTNQPLLGPIILPELWEDLVVPGMYVRMHMWPMSPPIGSVHPPPPPPPMPHAPPLAAPVGRGRGRGRGAGPGPPMPHIVPEPVWMPMGSRVRPRGMPSPPPPPRPKTRKRPE